VGLDLCDLPRKFGDRSDFAQDVGDPHKEVRLSAHEKLDDQATDEA